jgi:hypothetical protein
VGYLWRLVEKQDRIEKSALRARKYHRLRRSEINRSSCLTNAVLASLVLPRLELEQLAVWVSMNPFGGRFHEPDSKTLHA